MMTIEDKLVEIEQQLSDIDPQAASFDFEVAGRCKDTLARIANSAATLCAAIQEAPSRQKQRRTGWKADVERTASNSAQQATQIASGRVRIENVGPVNFVRVEK